VITFRRSLLTIVGLALPVLALTASGAAASPATSPHKPAAHHASASHKATAHHAASAHKPKTHSAMAHQSTPKKTKTG
jgi:hypothetical protein